jgi:hypothetical protein
VILDLSTHPDDDPEDTEVYPVCVELIPVGEHLQVDVALYHFLDGEGEIGDFWKTLGQALARWEHVDGGLAVTALSSELGNDEGTALVAMLHVDEGAGGVFDAVEGIVAHNSTDGAGGWVARTLTPLEPSADCLLPGSLNDI